MDFDLDRLMQLFTVMLMTLATVVLLGPGAPSILTQHVTDRALVRLRARRWRRGFEVRRAIDIGLRANFETKTTPALNNLLVSFDSEIRLEPDIEMKRISESGH